MKRSFPFLRKKVQQTHTKQRKKKKKKFKKKKKTYHIPPINLIRRQPRHINDPPHFLPIPPPTSPQQSHHSNNNSCCYCCRRCCCCCCCDYWLFSPGWRKRIFCQKNKDRPLWSPFLVLSFFGKNSSMVNLQTQPRKIQFLRTFGVGPFFFFFGSNQRERYFSMEHGRWKVARRSLHQLPQPPPETFDDDNPQPPKINWSP